MNLICQVCFEEIEGKKYALPFNNMDNVCHEDCLEDWYTEHFKDVIDATTIHVEEEET